MWNGTLGWAMWLLMGLSTVALWVVVFLLVRELLPGADAPSHEHDADPGGHVVPRSDGNGP